MTTATADRVVEPEAKKGDDDVALRPQSLTEFVGQTGPRERIAIAVEAASARGEVCDHILLSGPPGLGKTTLANIVANTMGSKLITTAGPALKRPIDMVGLLCGLSQGDVLFIDEIHAIPTTVQEFLYPAMEDFKVDILTGSKQAASTLRVDIPHFTLVGATTRKGKLADPMRARFGIDLALDFYNVHDMKTIVDRSSEKLKVKLATGTAMEIAKRSRGTPRIANRLLRRVRDYAQVRGDGPKRAIDTSVAKRALNIEGVDMFGLDELDRRYLICLFTTFKGGPAGIEAIAATMQVDPEDLAKSVEPFLLHQGYVVRAVGGRVITSKGKNYFVS